MVDEKSENMIGRVVFSLFFVLVFSLGLMKPGVFVSVATLTPTDLLFPFLFLAWIVAIATNRLKFVWHPAFIAFGIYFFAIALSAIFSERPRTSFAKLVGELYLVVLPVVVVSVVSSVARLRQTFLAWMAGAVLPILIGFLGIFLFYIWPDSSLLGDITHHYGSVPVGNFPRISSTFVSPSMLCNYLTVTFAIAAGARSMNWLSSGAVVAFFAAALVCAAFTVSISLGGAILAVGLLIWRSSLRSSFKVAGLASAIVAAMAFVMISPFDLSSRPDIHYRFESPSPRISSPSPRLLVWSDAARRFSERPITGSGIGTPAAEVLFVNTDGSRSLLTDAHNTFLNVAAQAGVIGLAGLLFVIWSVMRLGFRRRSDELAGIQFALAVAFTAAFVYDGLTGSFEDARHLWVLMGLIVAVDKMDRLAPYA